MSAVSLTSTVLLVVVDVAAALLAVQLVRRPAIRPDRPWLRHVVVAIPLGLAIGWVSIWLIGDVLDVFEVSPTLVQRLWTSLMVAGAVLAVVNLVLAARRRRLLAGFALVVFVVAGGLGINRDVGEFQTLGQLLGVDDTAPLVLPPLVPGDPGAGRSAVDVAGSWSAPADLPAHGRVGSVRIPGVRSHFEARDAVVYLPPAALVAHPPRLPVVVLMTGQPGSPVSVMLSGHVAETLDADASRHAGLAPIVVVPDQLGSADANPLCVDGALGDSATYLTRDVPDWIRAHLNVQTSARSWAVGGFSQGGTCGLQFAAARPDLFGSLIDVSGQEGPALSSVEKTIQDGFAGDRARYRAAQPADILHRHAPYADSWAFFAVGSRDTRYSAVQARISAAAAAAGMHVERLHAPGSGHDWVTASRGFARGFAAFWARWGLGPFYDTGGAS
jgi:S-formylglutathione hydrolase FrmB